MEFPTIIIPYVLFGILLYTHLLSLAVRNFYTKLLRQFEWSSYMVISILSPLNHQHKKNFTKQQFDVTPVGKPETASWENFISLLENYFFPLCCFPNKLEYFFVCFLFFINQLPISPIFYLFS